MKKAVSLTDMYLQRLAKNLESLGPAETREVIAEVRSHIVEAQSETGDELAALETFGDPVDLATHILRERGVIVDDSTVPTAPRWMRSLAFLIDLAVSLVGLYLALIFLALGFLVPAQQGSWWQIPIACLELLACLAVLIWLPLRWIRERRRGAGTLGMRVMQIRRVRIGQERRIVRSRDIPGLMPTKAGRIAWGLRLVWAAVVLVLLVGIVWGVIDNLTRSSDGMRDVDLALQDGVGYAMGATGTIAGLYDAAMSGASSGQLAGSLSPNAAGVGARLIERCDAGLVEEYYIWSAELLKYTWPQPMLDELGETYTLRMKVVVAESPRGSETPVSWEYVVAYTETCTDVEEFGDGVAACSSEGVWTVTSMRLQDGQNVDAVVPDT